MHDLCFFDFFCSKIIFDQNFVSFCWDKLDYPGSILYLSCLLSPWCRLSSACVCSNRPIFYPLILIEAKWQIHVTRACYVHCNKPWYNSMALKIALKNISLKASRCSLFQTLSIWFSAFHGNVFLVFMSCLLQYCSPDLVRF